MQAGLGCLYSLKVEAVDLQFQLYEPCQEPAYIQHMSYLEFFLQYKAMLNWKCKKQMITLIIIVLPCIHARSSDLYERSRPFAQNMDKQMGRTICLILLANACKR